MLSTQNQITSSSSSSSEDAWRRSKELFRKREYFNFEPLFLDGTKLRYGKHL